ncbi:MAG: DNA repair protein RecN [Microscillaceae bacterium]|nr:DNA repair protein RecN [Microscillaceae bacterium]MDW8460327.1 DNA repair protein RecN [Cytophagales bacterium]
MLTDLYIKNYALIEQLMMKPHPALNIITGETGAGKSIMLGAIGLLLGNRADLKALLNTEEKCIVEAHFDITAYHLQPIFEEENLDYSPHTTIRREISPNGKSRAFINDTPVTLETLKKIGSYLIDIHSQHDNLQLGNNLFQLQVLDTFANNQSLLESYQQTYQQYRQKQKAYLQLQKEHDAFAKELEFNRFLLEELQKANLKANEQEILEQELQRLESSEEIKLKLQECLQYLQADELAINPLLKNLMQTLGSISKFSPQYQELRNRVESCLLELRDIAHEIEREQENIEHNPEHLAEVQSKLNEIYRLQQKHRVSTITELLTIQADLDQKVQKVLNFEDEIQALQNEVKTLEQQLLTIAQQLSESRKAVISPLELEIKSILADLGMPNATLRIVQETTPPQPTGIDNVNFLFTANKGISPKPIQEVASGGEFSRLMLAIKYILAQKIALPTLIFDEIDTGISGEVANKIGNIFKQMAKKHQIIAISHQLQIAAKGDHHYFVYKDDADVRTVSRIKQLSQEERIAEIAQMIAGTKVTESALASAKELLSSA